MLTNDAPAADLVKQIAEESLNTAVTRLEREQSGRSTYVYRLLLEDRTVYLRILPEIDNSFGAEVQVHALLRDMGVSVPKVIYYSPSRRISSMSFMIIEEIPGTNMIHAGSKDDILLQAGKQLAAISRVKVNGYGWIRRDREDTAAPLQAEKSSLHEFLFEFLDGDLALLAENGFGPSELVRIRSIVSSGAHLMGRYAPALVHGDFDDSHIYSHNGAFTGIIDFGEMQGNSPLYDLGHYKLHENPYHPGFRCLAAGYNEVRELSYDDQTEIDLWALWIGIRRFGMVGRRTWGGYQEHLLRKIRLLATLLAAK